MRDGEFKTVAWFTKEVSAQILAGMLNENGIAAAVFGSNSSLNALNYVNPIEVKVNAADYEAAMKLVEEDRKAAEEALEREAENWPSEDDDV